MRAALGERAAGLDIRVERRPRSELDRLSDGQRHQDVVAEFDRDIGQDRGSYARNGALVVSGLVLLLFGSDLLLDSALSTAAALGVSDLVIGLTLVAIGTSLPELAVSVVSALKGEHDMAIGNIGFGDNLTPVTPW